MLCLCVYLNDLHEICSEGEFVCVAPAPLSQPLLSQAPTRASRRTGSHGLKHGTIVATELAEPPQLQCCELTALHAGATWTRPAKLLPATNANPKARRQWAWVHWELQVQTVQFYSAAEVWCRAWDESQNVQPTELTWNLLGQGNNSVFRLRLHKELDDEVRLRGALLCTKFCENLKSCWIVRRVNCCTGGCAIHQSLLLMIRWSSAWD